MKIWMEDSGLPQFSLGDVDDAVVVSGTKFATEHKRNEFCGSFISAYCSVATD